MSITSLLRHPENAGLPAKNATTSKAYSRWANAKLPAEKAYLALDFRLQSSASLNISTHAPNLTGGAKANVSKLFPSFSTEKAYLALDFCAQYSVRLSSSFLLCSTLARSPMFFMLCILKSYLLPEFCTMNRRSCNSESLVHQKG